MGPLGLGDEGFFGLLYDQCIRALIDALVYSPLQELQLRSLHNLTIPNWLGCGSVYSTGGIRLALELSQKEIDPMGFVSAAPGPTTYYIFNVTISGQQPQSVNILQPIGE